MPDHGYENPFLAKAMTIVRANRPQLAVSQPYFNRIERVPAGRYAEVWFRTAGCTWDKQGGCTMCNYGTSQRPTPLEIEEAVRAALSELPPSIEELMISPSGSMLDPLEVGSALRQNLYAMAADYDCKKFLIETRSEYVTDETMSALKASQPSSRDVVIEIGLESADSWKLRYCINKGHGADDFVRATEVARRNGVEVYANICLGTAFLTQSEAVDDAYESSLWALEHGASHVVLFPLHIKPFTLLDVLAKEGRYSVVSLWALVEVLSRFDPALLPRVEIAWYRSYYDTTAKIRKSPVSCPLCHNTVLEQLDEYRAEQSAEALERLLNSNCGCRQSWLETLQPSTEPLQQRVEREYLTLAESLGLSSWLERRPPDFFSTVRNSRVGEDLGGS